MDDESQAPPGICPCKITAAFLSRPEINAPVSAKMHREMGGGSYSREELLTHFDEEDREVVPRLRRYGMGVEANRMLREHRAFRMQSYWDFVEIQKHGLWEDTIMVKLLRRMGLLEEIVAEINSKGVG